MVDCRLPAPSRKGSIGRDIKKSGFAHASIEADRDPEHEAFSLAEPWFLHLRDDGLQPCDDVRARLRPPCTLYLVGCGSSGPWKGSGRVDFDGRRPTPLGRARTAASSWLRRRETTKLALLHTSAPPERVCPSAARPRGPPRPPHPGCFAGLCPLEPRSHSSRPRRRPREPSVPAFLPS
jgi:hypothetical protein